MAKTIEVMKALRDKYLSRDDYAYLEQVRNQTGFTTEPVRTADAIAMQLYPSRGLYIEGFEVKVSRSDWLSELYSPEKADAIAKFCHKWWVVAGDSSIVQVGEVPTDWGLLILKNNKITIKKQAPVQEAESMTYPMLAGILRNVSRNFIHRETIEDRIKVERDEARKDFERSHKFELEQIERLQQNVKEFEKISGLKIESWNLGDVAEAVRVIQRGGLSSIRQELKRIQEEITQALKDTE